jgi:hypothetical protein
VRERETFSGRRGDDRAKRTTFSPSGRHRLVLGVFFSLGCVGEEGAEIKAGESRRQKLLKPNRLTVPVWGREEKEGKAAAFHRNEKLTKISCVNKL